MRLCKKLVGHSIVFRGADAAELVGLVTAVRNGIATVSHLVPGNLETFTAYVAGDRVVRVLWAVNSTVMRVESRGEVL